MATYGVDSLHVNVFLGDAAIHLQLKLTNDAGTVLPRPWILNAILIDGGHNRKLGVERLQLTLDTIRTRYLDAAGATFQFLKFNAVVITHWDHDHYRGLQELLNANYNVPTKINTDREVLSNRCDYFKYDARGNPQTIFYVPYWKGVTTGTDAKRGANPRFIKVVEGTNKYMTFMVNVSPNSSPRLVMVEKIAKIQDYTEESFLGTELFTNTPLPTGHEERDMTAPALLLAAHNPTRPGIYCVAANKHVIGFNGITPAPTARLFKPPVMRVVNELNTEINQCSIGAMVIWPDGRLSHYFAGDADFETETEIMNWTGTTGRSSDPTKHLAAMKASHHGAATSLPRDMFTKFNPRSIILSCGNDYGHPRWELFFYLEAWLLNGNADSTQWVKPFFPMVYPYWFAIDANSMTGDYLECTRNKLKISPKIFAENSEVCEDYQQALQAVYAQIQKTPEGSRLTDPYTRFMDETNDGDTYGVLLHWIIDEVSARFDTVTYIDNTASNATTGTFVGPTGLPTTSGDSLQYMRVACRATADDGRVFIKKLTPVAEVDFHPVIPVPTKNMKRAVKATGNNVRTVIKQARPGKKPRPNAKKVDRRATSSPNDAPSDDSDEGDDIDNMIVEKTKKGRRKGKLLSLLNSRLAVTNQLDAAPGTPPPVVLTTGYWYFCKELAQIQGPTINSLPDGIFNDFVTSLHNGVISLASAPTAVPPAAATVISLLDTDEWLAWFQDAIGATSLTAKATTAGIESFTTVINVADTVSLAFDTSATNTIFGLSGNTALQPNGVVPDFSMIVFGISPSPANQLIHPTLGQMMHFAGISLGDNPLIHLLDGISMSVDPTKYAGSRNGIFFSPGENYKTVARLEAHVDDSGLAILNRPFSFLSNFKFVSATIVSKKTVTWSMRSDGAITVTAPEMSISTVTQISVDSTTVHFKTTLIIHPTTVSIILDLDDETAPDDPLTHIMNWLGSFLGIASIGDWIKAAGSDLGNPKLRRFTLDIQDDGTGLHVSGVKVDIQISLNMGTSGNTAEECACLLEYSWPSGDFGRLMGCLWPAPMKPDLLPLLNPDYETYMDFTAVATPGKILLSTLDLATLGPGGSTVKDFPVHIPTTVCSAVFQIDSDGMSFNGMISTEDPPASKMPSLSLNQVGLDARYTFAKAKADPPIKSSLSVELGFWFLVAPPASTPYPSCNMNGTVYYEENAGVGQWSLGGSIFDLNVATIASFFDSDSTSSAMHMMAKISIPHLDMVYNFSKGHPSDFTFSGALAIGDLKLDLTYHYDADVQNFSASLGTSPQAATPTIQDILDSISDDIGKLPSFVGDIIIPSASNGGAISLIYDKSKSADGYLIFALSINISVVGFTMVQLRHKDWAADHPPKRMIRVSLQNLDQMPGLSDVPVVKKLAQPFDELDFVWVQDSGPPLTGEVSGFTVKDIQTINDDLPEAARKFLFKSNKATPQDDDIAIQVGNHFMVALNESKGPTVVLDYILGAKEPPKTSLKGTSSKVAVRRTVKDAEPTPTPPAVGAVQKSFGPLLIDNLGLQYHDGALFVILDATFQMGPISFSLLGFGFGVNLKDFTLTDFPDVEFTLAGMAIGFNQPPVEIAGLFEHKGGMYYGGVTVGFTPYMFLAAGGYGEVTQDNETFKTVFLFAELEGPLITLEFASLEDICGGFGYNSDLTFPTASQVPTFPFIGANMAGKTGTTPIDTIKKITDGTWINAKNHSLWFAVGLKVEAFECLSIKAVVCVEFNSSVTLGIFGDAQASLPDSKSPGAKIFFVELGIAAVVDFGRGTMTVEAELAPSSYILDPNCHLTGGFALSYWFHGSPYEGDWVFSVGGYHPSFQRPPHYPNPSRLAISWSLDGGLSITGQAYFAITPKIVMGGGLLSANLSLGPLEAYFDAYADFLINYKPFHFVGDAGIDIGVRFSMDLLFVTIHISVDISAHLYIEGLPFRGSVYVDFWVFGFTIHFGPSANPVQAVDFATFYKMLVTASNPGAAAAVASTTGDHTLAIESGMIASSDATQTSKQGDIWQVRAPNFAFRVTGFFGMQTVTIVGRTDDEGKCADPNPIFSTPMHITKDQVVKSDVTISIQRLAGEEDPTMWSLEPVFKAVPVALWSAYDGNNDPISGKKNNDPTLLNGDAATSPHLMGFTVVAPPSTLADDIIPAFNAAAAQAEIVQEPPFPPLEDANPAFLPAQGTGDADQWEAVKSAWENPSMGKGKAQEFVDAWVEVLGWVLDDGVEGLVGVPPKLTIDAFDQTYMAAPLLEVGA